MTKRKTILEKFLEDFELRKEIDINELRREVPFVRFTKKDVMAICDELEMLGLVKKKGRKLILR